MGESTTLSRRETLLAAGGLIAAALIPEAASAAGSGPAGVVSGAISCVLTPELTEGPYYVPAEKVRRNITERKPGAPFDLRPHGRRRLDVQADQERRRRHLARGCARRLLGRGSRDTRNAADSIYRNGGSRSMHKVTKVAGGYRGAITMGVHRG